MTNKTTNAHLPLPEVTELQDPTPRNQWAEQVMRQTGEPGKAKIWPKGEKPKPVVEIYEWEDFGK